MPDRDVYKLAKAGNPAIILDLISQTDKEDHVYMHLIELPRLIYTEIKSISVFPGIWLHLPAKLLFIVVLKVMHPL